MYDTVKLVSNEKRNQNSTHHCKKQVVKNDSFKMPWMFSWLIEWGEALSGQGVFPVAFQTREKHKRTIARIAFFVDRSEYLALKNGAFLEMSKLDTLYDTIGLKAPMKSKNKTIFYIHFSFLKKIKIFKNSDTCKRSPQKSSSKRNEPDKRECDRLDSLRIDCQ